MVAFATIFLPIEKKGGLKLIQNLEYMILPLLVFLLELGIFYKLYHILYEKFFGKKSSDDQLKIEINIFRCIYLTIALYLFDVTGFPISKVLIDAGILWVVGMISILFLIYRITIALEER